MRLLRWTLLGTGLAATGLGLALVAAPDLLRLDATLAVVGAVGLAILVGVVVVHGRAAAPRTTPSPPAAEGRTGWSVPGDEFDAWLADLAVAGANRDAREAGDEADVEGTEDDAGDDASEGGGRARTATGYRDAVAARVEAAAVAVLVHHRGLDESAARERLAAGTWTDDPAAAAFLADDPPAPTLRDQLRALRTGEPTAGRRARRAVEALAGIADGGEVDDRNLDDHGNAEEVRDG